VRIIERQIQNRALPAARRTLSGTPELNVSRFRGAKGGLGRKSSVNRKAMLMYADELFRTPHAQTQTADEFPGLIQR
jgi:hypothetical protein